MKERLEKFIRTEGLTPSRFAEIMGVQPSSISHILSGRNKPSFDFIEKMLLRFPKVNPDWLLVGKGSIYRATETIPSSNSTTVSKLSPTPSSQPLTGPATNTLPFDVLSAGESRQLESPYNSSQISNSQEASTATSKPIQEQDGKLNSIDLKKTVREMLPDSGSFPQVSEEMIDQIVIFLKDKTFISYRPK